MRVPPKLMAGARRGSRARGKSDAHRRGRGRARLYARARPAERSSGRPRAGDPPAHRPPRGSRRRAHPHPAAPALAPARARARARAAGGLSCDRRSWLERIARRLARAEHTAQVRICRELVGRCRELSRRALELEREIAALVRAQAPALLALPGCGVLTAAKLVGETAGVGRFHDDAKLAMHAGAAPLPASSGAAPASPPESLGQPSTQLCPASHRGYPGLGAPACPGLPRAQGERRALTQGSSALSQASPRPRRLPDAAHDRRGEDDTDKRPDLVPALT